VFEEFMGIPAHPLLVHAAVVFVPLLALTAIGYALSSPRVGVQGSVLTAANVAEAGNSSMFARVVSRLRESLGWLMPLLAILGMGAALMAKLSGDAFRARQIRRGLGPGPLLTNINNHRAFGNMTLWFTLALGVIALILWYLRRSANSNKAIDWVLRVLAVLLAIVAGYYVIRTGDSGGRMVWGNS
jgi:hypothetical protein